MAALEGLSVLDEKGQLNNRGLGLLADLLEHLPKVHEGRWKQAFVPMVSRLVRVCVDLAVVKKGKVLLKWRKDEYWEGWEMPGGSLGPGESWRDAAMRFGEEEFGMNIEFLKEIGTFNNTNNLRAHDVTVLLLCRPKGEPKKGEWFAQCPANLINVHQKYWPVAAPYFFI